MSVLHAALAAVTLGVGNRNLAPPLYATDVDFVENNRTPVEVAAGVPRFELVPSFVQIGSFPLTWWVASFFLCSALAHAGNATLWRSYYERNLSLCLAPTRYLEYAVSAPLMIVLIAYTAGTREYLGLVALALLMASVMPFGYLTDLMARPASEDRWSAPLRIRLFPFALGFLPFLSVYGIILANFYDQSASADRAPWFVHLVVWLQLGLFGAFAVVPLFQQLRAPRAYYQGELAFQVLSLASKATLGMLFLTNVLVLGSFAEAF